ncbi:E3 ubiquitin-protein ligase DTX3L [Discoglossus pictus]
MAGAAPTYSIFVRTSRHCDKNLSRKVQKYFQSKKSGGGECDVKSHGEDTYRVSFKSEEDCKRALNKKEHCLEEGGLNLIIVDMDRNELLTANNNQSSTEDQEKEAKTSNGEGRVEKMSPGEGPSNMKYTSDKARENSENNHQKDVPSWRKDERRGTKRINHTKSSDRPSNPDEQPPSDAIFSKIFTLVSAELNTKTFSKEQRQDVKNKFPRLQVSHETSQGIEKVTGTFDEIDQLHKYLEHLMEDDREFPHQTEERPPQSREGFVKVQPALYEYFHEIYHDVLRQIKDELKVDIKTHKLTDSEMCIDFVPRRSPSDVERAKQLFTDTIQMITHDWKQDVVNLPEHKFQSIEAIKQSVRERFDNIFVIVEGNKVILRGPANELPKAKKFLEGGEIASSGSQRVIQISSQGMKRELTVSNEHMQIVQQLKSREIKEIERKFNVTIEGKPEKQNSVKVTFRGSDGLDLGVHASQNFLSLLQKTITNIHRKVVEVSPDLQESQLSLFAEGLNLDYINIIIQYNKGAVVLIGSPNDVRAAEKKLNAHLTSAGAQAITGLNDGDVEPMDTSDFSPPTLKSDPEEGETCPICMDKLKNKKILDKCKHVFCTECIQQAMSYKPVCPICNVTYGVIKGTQPDGSMKTTIERIKLPGYKCDTIQIKYSIPSGTQGVNHPNPGRPFTGTQRTAYLPDNAEGQEILGLLKKAFDQKLIFTVGDSRTTTAKDSVTWNDIHHKTNTSGGPAHFGYPDPNYLKRVREELKAKGIE